MTNGIEIDMTKLVAEEAAEVYLIAQGQGQTADLSDEEREIAEEMKIEYVSFASGSGVYKDKNDAIAVAKKLIEADPTRKLAVLSAIV